jgi:hypothetical protein
MSHSASLSYGRNSVQFSDDFVVVNKFAPQDGGKIFTGQDIGVLAISSAIRAQSPGSGH